MSKKFLPVLLVLTIASLFVAFQTQGRGGDNPKTKNEKILRNVGLLLEQGHYSPKNINDSFSKQVLNRFLKDLDEDKSIFLQSDIDSFAKYNNKIDDEIHGAKLESFYVINDVFSILLFDVVISLGLINNSCSHFSVIRFKLAF